jgi:hypothetical protein
LAAFKQQKITFGILSNLLLIVGIEKEKNNTNDQNGKGKKIIVLSF